MVKKEIKDLIEKFNTKLELIDRKKVNELMYTFNKEEGKPDIILVLASSSIYRMKKAIELANKYNTKILVSGGNYLFKDKMYEYEKYYIYAICHGFDEDRIILEKKSTNTLENLSYSFKQLKKMKVKSIYVVSNMQHMLRVSLTIKKYFNNLGYTFCFIGSSTKRLCKRNWYRTKRSRNIVKGELERIIKYDLI